MRGRRRAAGAVAVLLLLAPTSALASVEAIAFDPPTRVDRPGRGTVHARQSSPQLAETASGPLVVWEDDRSAGLGYVAAVRGGAWTEVSVPLDPVATVFASDGAGTAWAIADSPDGITTRSTRDGRTWAPGPRPIGRHASWHALAAAGSDGRILVARAALDVANCARVGRLSHLPTAGERGDATGLDVGELIRGDVRRDAVKLEPAGRYVDVDVALAPSGTGWAAAATLHGIAVYREIAPQRWEPVPVPGIVPAASIQRVRVAPTEHEVVVLWQLLRGRDRQVVSRTYRLASRTWGDARVLGPHDGTPSLDAIVARPSQRGQESSVVAAWISENEVAIAERHRREWHPSPSSGGGLPESLALATIDGRAAMAYAARRVDGSTTVRYGGPNTDVFVRMQEGEGHWEPGQRVDGEARLMKRASAPRVWTSGREAFVTFDEDVDGSGAPVIARRSGGWAPQRVPVSDESDEIALVAPDGSVVIRAGDAFVFRDRSSETFATVGGVGRENDIVVTGDRRFAVASIVGDPGRGQDQRFEIHDVGPGRHRTARLTVGPTTDVDLLAGKDGDALVVTTRPNRDTDTRRVDVRRFRDGRLGAARTIAADVRPDHVVGSDGDGGLLVASVDRDRIVVVRSSGAARSLPLASQGSQFLLSTARDEMVIVASNRRMRGLVVALSDGGPFAFLPPLPGRFAEITGLGYGYASAASESIAAPSCFAATRTSGRAFSGMVGWKVDTAVTSHGGVTVTARHRADVLVAQIERGAREWSYGEAGTRSKLADGDVGVDDDGRAVAAWLDVDGRVHRVLASSAVTRSGGGWPGPVAAAVAALALLALAFGLRRRAA